MKSFQNIAIIGASGSIAQGFIAHLLNRKTTETIFAFSSKPMQSQSEKVHTHLIDYENESSIEDAAKIATQKQLLDLVIVTTGILHGENWMPEKALRDLSSEKLKRVFYANVIVPSLVMKYFLPNLNHKPEVSSVFAALSARVGSISDNRLGGWYAYRSAKAALNMMVKNAAIEMARVNKSAIVIGLHPGTVDSALSKPFQARVPKEKLFSPTFSTEKMLTVLDNLNPAQSGKCFAYDGLEIQP